MKKSSFLFKAAWSFLMEMEYLRRLGNAMKSNEQPTLYNVATTTPNSNAKFRTQQKKKSVVFFQSTFFVQ